MTAGDLRREDRVLVVGRGSSDPVVHEDFAKISTGIRERLGIEHVSVCFMAAAEPRLREGLQMITIGATGRVIVVPYLLFSGLLTAEVSQEVRKRQKQGQPILHTGPLSGHRVIEDIVVKRAMGE